MMLTTLAERLAYASGRVVIHNGQFALGTLSAVVGFSVLVFGLVLLAIRTVSVLMHHREHAKSVDLQTQQTNLSNEFVDLQTQLATLSSKVEHGIIKMDVMWDDLAEAREKLDELTVELEIN